ncbi:unnamed protein product [Ectocarpus sp. 12 AP-2014]
MNSNLTYKTFPDVDFSALKLDGVRPGKSGMKFASIVGANGRRLVIETPAMTIPWDTAIRMNEETGQMSAKIALSFQGMGDDTDDGKVRRFYNFLNGMDNRVKELALEHKGELWQKDMDAGTINAFFQKSVKPSSKPDKYPPSFQGKIPLQDGKNPSSEDMNEAKEMKIVVFRKDKTPVPPSELKGGCLASVIAEASYLWCTPMMIGVAWVVKFVLVEPKARENEFQFTELDDFEDVQESTSDKKRKRGVDEDDQDSNSDETGNGRGSDGDDDSDEFS